MLGSNGSKKPEQPPPPAMLPPGGDSSLSMRLRVVEEKSNNLNRKIEFLERNMVESNKKKNEMLRNFDSELLELKHEIDGIKQKMDLIIRELKMTAGKEELTSIKRYLDLWSLAKFVTRDEIDHIVEEAVESHVSARAIIHPIRTQTPERKPQKSAREAETETPIEE